MSQEETARSGIVKAIQALIDNGTITSANYNNNTTNSRLVSAHMKIDKSGLSRPKIRAIWDEVLKERFDKSEDAAETDSNEPETTEAAEPETSSPPIEEKPKASAPKKTRQTKKEATADSFESKVENSDSKRKPKSIQNTKKSPTQSSRRKIAFCRGLNIDNTFSKYNTPDVQTITEFPASDVELEQAEHELITFFTNNEDLCDTYSEARESFIASVSELRKTYAIDEAKAKKQQHFTVSKKTVKYVDPNDEKFKQADLPESDQTCFREYETSINDFTKSFKAAMKGDKPKRSQTAEEKAAAHTHDLEFLLLDVIRTQNIIKIDTLQKFTETFDEFASKATNTIVQQLPPEEWAKIESDKKYKSFAPDYIQLFIDIKKFNGSNYGRLCKTIYNHRDALIHHSKLTRDLKTRSWLQALANIKHLKESSAESNLIIDCWENILSSEYAWKIVMLGLPPSDFFKHAFELLIQDPLSVELYESALYPISFVFTPNMLGYNDFEAPDKLFGKTDATYKKNLQLVLESFGNPLNKYYDYDACNWLYYFNKSGTIRNESVDMLHHAVELANKQTSESEEQ